MGSSNPGCLKFLNYTDLKVNGSTQKPKCPQDGTARWERKQSYFSWNIKRVPPIPKTGGKTTRKDIRVIPRQEAKPPGKTSELSQDRRQNHQERQQSYPKTGGKTTRKDIRVIPRQEAKPPKKNQSYPKTGGKTTRKDIRVIPRQEAQEAKPPGKTSELSQDRRQNHQERHQSYPKTGGKTTRKDIRVIPRQEAKPPGPRQEAKPPGKTSELSQDRRQNHQERHQSYPKTGGKTTRTQAIGPQKECLRTYRCSIPDFFFRFFCQHMLKNNISIKIYRV